MSSQHHSLDLLLSLEHLLLEYSVLEWAHASHAECLLLWQQELALQVEQWLVLAEVVAITAVYTAICMHIEQVFSCIAQPSCVLALSELIQLVVSQLELSAHACLCSEQLLSAARLR